MPDYSGSAADLARTLRQAWFYTGQRSGISEAAARRTGRRYRHRRI